MADQAIHAPGRRTEDSIQRRERVLFGGEAKPRSAAADVGYWAGDPATGRRSTVLSLYVSVESADRMLGPEPKAADTRAKAVKGSKRTLNRARPLKPLSKSSSQQGIELGVYDLSAARNLLRNRVRTSLSSCLVNSLASRT
jgi:hypothetical protein